MSEHRCMLNKMNKIEIYVVNEDTDINPSVQEAIELFSAAFGVG